MIYIGMLLIFLPLVIGFFIIPLCNMIYCLKEGGDWQYYGDQVLVFIVALVISVGFALIVLGTMR